jgi:hypothetical protein
MKYKNSSTFTSKTKFNNLNNKYPSINSIQSSNSVNNFKQLFTIKEEVNNLILEA